MYPVMRASRDSPELKHRKVLPGLEPKLNNKPSFTMSRPNFFVGFRLRSPELVNAVIEIQNTVINRAPNLIKCRMDVAKLHLTCFVLQLQSKDQIDAAASCLASCQSEFDKLFNSKSRCMVLVKSIGIFDGSKVLYAAPTNDDTMRCLAELTSYIENQFINHGIIYPERLGHKWTPHITILKTSYDRKNGRSLKIKASDILGCESVFFRPASVLNNQDLNCYTGTSYAGQEEPRGSAVLVSVPVRADMEESNATGTGRSTGRSAGSMPSSAFEPQLSTEAPLAAAPTSPAAPTAVAAAAAAAVEGVGVEVVCVDLLSMGEVDVADGYYKSYARLLAVPPPL
jgi:2'-5' RNA ligase